MKHILIFLSVLISAGAQAVELMKWERIPLQISLNVDQERIIFVDRNVRIGYPASLDGKIRLQSAGGTVYLLANEPFPPSRLQLRNVENGELILLDISAKVGKTVLEPVKLVYGDSVFSNQQDGGRGTQNTASEAQPEQPYTLSIPQPVALTRYAAQSLYAPLRTIEALPGIQQVSVRLPATISTLLPSEPIIATPLNAWRSGNYVVTAIKLKNTSRQRIALDPRALQGHFYAATFQHAWLGAIGTPEDTTVVYLVTRNHGAEQAVLPEPVPETSNKLGAKP
ncbi:TIGR03749 family integrating conjugative element protein [Limnobaculum zhutongyuii]|uniref:TIGR03749 family integrating conjugative element protein n=1 Tax=Limnobaculum zhutongyuii TaxID=2498113 RepID=A0A411WM31_9GAMM|nr:MULTISPECIES: TIGR03749 family integrating conjugative element protein [Limnobaculum]QBH97228.1 TIGR03749 family integrating conjugative element protein [Limnobaculum zhutongyuii]TQS88487.1 TIGR03749 family integrating conjugative element protein [Limnobaculum zhutongyuii]